MSPQEMQVLQNFLDQLVQVQGVSKDPQAAALISQAATRQPDTTYLLVQRALLLEQALVAANTQISSLQADLREQKALNALPASSAATPFLDPASSAWGNSASTRPLSPAPVTVAVNAPAATSVTGNPLTTYGTAAASAPFAATAIPQSGSSFFGGQGGSLLGNVAATAAGVAAGAFLYQGLSHLIGGGSQHSVLTDQSMNQQLTSNEGGMIPGYFSQNPEPASSPDFTTDFTDTDAGISDDSDIV
ncbi:DUF2076 family protein [Undibacterium oligocarboniphilum]|uniref:DUF2076 family protein n=1 Tax=Undibacterium oligocarboniphilum TaxID=666702 RepID=A0A850QG15_9BURK|nr:DUF2076 family protein [Undibacterium oligocarboniphilum]MBC3869528.1 DUF2076 family protein [Undibacterium oligocarboniphilum]NVO77907.1 DUF2076 family protein [Undibacterium oligocarboniphilum]